MPRRGPASSPRCAEHGLGLIADIVPNHVALEGNAWWIDVLTHGTASACFPVFDVDLSADPYAGPASAKLLIPILGEPYGRELAAGRLRLVIEQGKPLVAYAGNRFPLSITSRAALDDEPEGQGEHGDEDGLAAIAAALNADTARLHALLEAQHYRLTWWRLARDESPYRRFFDVNGLIGVRVEEPDGVRRDAPPRRSSGSPTAASTACASITSMGSRDPAPTCGGCGRWHRRSGSGSRRSSPRARPCRRGRSTARPATRPARCSRG